MQKEVARLWAILEEDGKLVAGRVKLGSDIGVVSFTRPMTQHDRSPINNLRP